MNYVIIFMMSVSLIFSVFTGKTAELSSALVSGGVEAVSLLITISGGILFWGGTMRVAQKSGLCDKIAKLISLPVSRIFKNLNTRSTAFNKICMNITANLLGIGNAATPIGLEAMQELNALNRNGTAPSEYMTLFVIMNSSSLQILPTTVSMIRASFNSKNPMEILPAVLLCSASALFAALLFAKLYFKVRKIK